jgi:hypothetical protein
MGCLGMGCVAGRVDGLFGHGSCYSACNTSNVSANNIGNCHVLNKSIWVVLFNINLSTKI